MYILIKVMWRVTTSTKDVQENNCIFKWHFEVGKEKKADLALTNSPLLLKTPQGFVKWTVLYCKHVQYNGNTVKRFAREVLLTLASPGYQSSLRYFFNYFYHSPISIPPIFSFHNGVYLITQVKSQHVFAKGSIVQPYLLCAFVSPLPPPSLLLPSLLHRSFFPSGFHSPHLPISVQAETGEPITHLSLRLLHTHFTAT